MSRSRQRVCLEDGLKLNLNRLKRNGIVIPGYKTGPRSIYWTSSYWGEVASGLISANMEGTYEGWLRIELGKLDQWITLVPQPRHFGGRQWYFVCPVMNRKASVLWKPPGSTRFCSRQTWRRQVAYSSQFLDRDNRAHRGQSKIKNRLNGDHDPDDWSLPPKPKWMRWKTYQRHVDRFDRYEDILNEGIAELAARFLLDSKSVG